MIFFKIIEEVKKRETKCGDAKQVLIKLSRKFHPNTVSPNTRLHQISAEGDLNVLTSDPEHWII